MAAEQSQSSLEIQISNKTKNITLKNPRMSDDQNSTTLRPQLPPGSSDSCRFSNDSSPADIAGLLIYEAESFTLAILIIIPEEQDDRPQVLQLELSLDKAHLGDWEEISPYISLGWDLPDSDNTTVCRGEFPGKVQGTVKLSAGPVRVRATVSHGLSSFLEVLLMDKGEFEEELAFQRCCRQS